MSIIRLLRRDLAMEITAWVGEGLITREQATQICARYGLDYAHLTRQSLGYLVLSGLGVLFVALSVITVIGANWDDIPRGLRMGALLALTLGANVTGLLYYRKQRTAETQAWFCLGGLLYGASIMLIAQIYHLGEHYPDGIFWWAMGVLPVALLLESTLIMLVVAVLSWIWFFTETSMDFYPTMFPVFIIATGWHLWRSKRSLILFLSLVLATGFWIEFTLAWMVSDRPGFEFGKDHVVMGMALFLVYYGVAKLMASQRWTDMKDYATVLHVWVLRFLIVMLMVMSFEAPWKELLEAQWDHSALAVGIALGSAGLAVLLTRLAGASLVNVTIYALLLNVVVLSLSFASMTTADALSYQFGTNFVLIATGIGLILRGIQDNITHYFYLGLISILVTALLRYIDLFDDYVGASLMFAVCAVILFLSARYWRKRHLAEAEGGEA